MNRDELMRRIAAAREAGDEVALFEAYQALDALDTQQPSVPDGLDALRRYEAAKEAGDELGMFSAMEDIEAAERAAGIGEPTAAKPATKPAAKPEPFDFSVARMLSNVPSSAMNLAGGIADVVLNPIDTAVGLGNLGTGLVQKVLPEALQAESARPQREMVDLVGKYYADRYGGGENILRSLESDPVGIAADASMLLGGGAGLATKANLGKTAGALNTASRLTNPVGEAVGKVVSATVPRAANALGKIEDVVTGKGTVLNARRVLRNAAGDNYDQVRQALAVAPSDVTASQAIADAGVTASTVMGIEDILKGKVQGASDKYIALEKAQREAREKQLRDATPDLAEAKAARERQATTDYEKAYAADLQRLNRTAETRLFENAMGGATGIQLPDSTPVSPALNALRSNPMIQDAMRTAKQYPQSYIQERDPPLAQIYRDNFDVTDPMGSLGGLQVMKFALQNAIKNPQTANALQKYDAGAIKSTLRQFNQAVNADNPLFGVANANYAMNSIPVNQAELGNQMLAILTDSLYGERPRPFVNAVNDGQMKLIKKATGESRFDSLEDALNPEQVAAKNKIERELRRDAEVNKQLTKKGRESASSLLKMESKPVLIPNTLTLPATIFNAVSSRLKGKVNDATLIKLSDAMLSAKSTKEILDMVPAAERSKVAQFLNSKAFKESLPTAARTAGQLADPIGLTIQPTLEDLASTYEE